MSSREEMLTELPPIFRESPDFQEMARVQAIIFDRLERDIDDVLNQFFIDNATWGLAIMEKEFKLPIDINKPMDQRRSALKAKKRGIGTVRASMIKSIAESFQNGSVSVQAIKNQSTILITFNDVYGTPPNLEDIKVAIRKVLPAHRIVDFQFKYLLIKQVNTMTIANLETNTLNKFAGGV
ncbi:putative phage tail protein [Peribacillus loiseleuriae]|uniref:putative phage tail protein n=1 Tax=Peribacillus loiseleuriae TaxID=1679170 RepID=UPI003CFEBEFC